MATPPQPASRHQSHCQSSGNVYLLAFCKVWVGQHKGTSTNSQYLEARANQPSSDHAGKTLTKAENPPDIFGCDR